MNPIFLTSGKGVLLNGGSGLMLSAGPDVHCKAFIRWLVPDTCLWLDPPWLNLRVSIALNICDLVSSKCVNWIRLFLCDDKLHELESLHAS